MHPNAKDLTGQRFRLLTVFSRAENGKNGRTRWNCVCDCGGSIVASAKHLNRGQVVSCGCVKRSIRTTHGMSYEPIYSSWKSMIARCQQKTTRQHRYKDRGIRVCERWQSFENFYEDMGSAWFEGATLDRLDNDGNYCPENCRWASQRQQAGNRSNNTVLTYNGETQIVSEWARRYNLNPGTLWNRVFIYGWAVEKALNTPVAERRARR